MPKIKNSITLTEFTFPKPPQLKNGDRWKKFDISGPNSYKTRLTVCYNLSRAVELLHTSKKYTLVDLKPDNIMVNENGIITVIDLDSIQVSDEKGNILFHTNVYTEEYAPPEFYNNSVKSSKSRIDHSWDVFSFSVICYKLLLVIHPFQASHKDFHTVADLIKQGYFVHGAAKNELHIIPKYHYRYKELPKSIRNSFFKSFERGFYDPKYRPEMAQWVSVLSKELSSGLNCNPNVNYSNLYKGCVRKKQQHHKVDHSSLEISVTKQFYAKNVELYYATKGAVKCKVNDRVINLKGCIVVDNMDSFYLFEIENSLGKVVRKRIDIIGIPPTIQNFKLVYKNERTGILYWMVSNASKVEINGIEVNHQGEMEVDLSKSKYILNAQNASSKEARESVTNKLWFRNRNHTINTMSSEINYNESINTSFLLRNIAKLNQRDFSINA